MADTIGMAQVADGEIGVVGCDPGQVGPRLLTQLRDRCQGFQELRLFPAVQGQLGKRDAQHLVGVEARVARPWP